MSTVTSCHFGHLLQVSKNISLKSDFIIFFFMILYMYIAPGQGLTTPWGQNVDVNRNILSLWSFVANLKKISLKSWFYTNYFMISYMYIAPGQGQTAPRGQFWCPQKGLITSPICCKFQRNLFWSLILYNFFHDLMHVYSPGAGGIQPLGDKVLMSTETSCHFGHLLLVSKHSFWKIHCFTFSHTKAYGTKFDVK